MEKINREKIEQFRKLVYAIEREIRHTCSNEVMRNVGRDITRELSQLPITLTFRDRPVKNDLERAVAIASLLFIIGCAPTLIPLHFLLHKMGRKGFYGDKKIYIDWNSLKKRD